tara:strand:- start:1480 stop:1923 length:444 start_codon:yes stop_codon:yes gene_type:complete
VAKYFSGKDGALLVDDVEVSQLQNWSFSQSMSILEITAMGDTDRTIKPGVRSYSGSARAYYYTSTATDAPNVTKLLEAALKTSGTESSRVTLILRMEETAGSDTNARDLKVNAYVTSVGLSSSVGEISSVDFSFEVDGAPTVNTINT